MLHYLKQRKVWWWGLVGWLVVGFCCCWGFVHGCFLGFFCLAADFKIDIWVIMEIRFNVNYLQKTNATGTLKICLNQILFVFCLKDFLILQNKLQRAFMDLPVQLNALAILESLIHTTAGWCLIFLPGEAA